MAPQAPHAPPNTMQKLLTVQETAMFLNTSPTTVYRYAKQNVLPHIRLPLGLRFRPQDLMEWIDQGRREDRLSKRIISQTLTFSPPGYIKDTGGKTNMANPKKGRRHYAYGSIFQRKPGGSWTIDFRTLSRVRIQKVAKGATSWQEAQEFLKQEVYESYFGQFQEKQKRQRVTFDSLADMYISDWAKVNKLGSWKTDEARIKDMKEFFKGRLADSITSQDIERFKVKKKASDLKLSTLNKYIQILSKLFNCGISWGYLKENPCRGVRKYPDEPFRRTRVLGREEETRLMKAVGPDHLKSMIIIFLNTGLRRKELFQLRWREHVDFRRRKLLIQETKTARSRYIPMNETVYNELKELHWSRKDDGLVFRNPKTREGFVCIRKALQGACRRAGIANLNLLDIRRTFATRIIEAGADIITVQQLLGHTSVKTTQIYTMSNQEQKRNAVALLDKVRVHSCDTTVTKEKGILVNNVFSVN